MHITADGYFSQELKSKIFDQDATPDRPDSTIHISSYDDKGVALSHYRQNNPPDIMGYIKLTRDSECAYIIVEVKKDEIKLRDIYQTKMYSDLFNAKFAILVTAREIPPLIKHLSEAIEDLISMAEDKQLIIAHFDSRENEFKEWYPKNPFK